MTTCTTRAAETWAHILAQPDGYPMGVAADWLQEQSDHDGSDEAKAEACAAVEAVAQQHLDAHPDDHRARRLLGEWLRWHGDRRGGGLMALAACGRFPTRNGNDRGVSGYCWTWFRSDTHDTDDLRPDWFALIDLFICVSMSGAPTPHWADWSTRRAAEDAAAIAFARLPAERREQLLKGDM